MTLWLWQGLHLDQDKSDIFERTRSTNNKTLVIYVQYAGENSVELYESLLLVSNCSQVSLVHRIMTEIFSLFLVHRIDLRFNNFNQLSDGKERFAARRRGA